MAISNVNYSIDTLINASILDCLKWLKWAKTKDGQRGRNYPDSLFDNLIGNNENEERFDVFETPEEFMLAREKILKGN